MPTIKEARLQKSQLAKDIQELRSKRTKVAIVEIAPGEDFHEYINTSVAALTAQIEAKMAAYLELNEKIQIANSLVRTNPDGTTFTIAGLITKALELRKELKAFKELASKNPKERSQVFVGSNDTVSVATYNIEKAGEKAQALTAQCNALSYQIDRLDNSIEV